MKMLNYVFIFLINFGTAIAQEEIDTTAFAGVGMAFMVFWIIWMIFIFFMVMVGLVGFVFWIFMLIDCAKRKFKKENDKVMWIVILALTNWIGAIIYYFIVKRKK